MVILTDMDSQEGSFRKTTNDKKIKNAVMKLLAGKVFIGKYVDKQYVYNLQTYRDVIIIDTEEDELINTLKEVKKLIQVRYGSNKWLGITSNTYDGTLQEYCLWVDLKPVPVGRHWFQISSIEFKNNEVLLNLKHLKLIETNVNRSFQESDFSVFNFNEIITYDNICKMIKFSSVVIMMLATFFVNAVWYFGNFSLIMIHELGYIIQILTPLLLGVLDFFTKCIAGFYWLIYMLWRRNSGSPPNFISPSLNEEKRQYRMKAIDYNASYNNRSNYRF